MKKIIYTISMAISLLAMSVTAFASTAPDAAELEKNALIASQTNIIMYELIGSAILIAILGLIIIFKVNRK